MLSPLIFWPWFACVAILAAGLVARRKSIAAASGLEKVLALGPVFFAAPLAAFAAEHFSNPRALTQLVPVWMPVRMFWTYFVGAALVCAALSIALDIQVQLSTPLLGIMFVLFVAMIHLPNAVAGPKNRILWTIVFRELCFGGGAFALAATRFKSLRTPARILVGVPVVFFAIEHFLHPEFASGVPLAKLTPDWVPVRAFWGYLTGAALLISGTTMLLDLRKRARAAAAILGLLVTLLVAFLYLPIFLTAAPAGLMEGINYVADTLLFAGTVLLAAAILH